MNESEFAAPLYERREPPATDDLLDLARRCTAHDASDAGVRKLQAVIRRLVERVEASHPDTARADVVERMLAGVILSLEDRPLVRESVMMDTYGLRAWWSVHPANRGTSGVDRRIAKLRREQDRLDAERERVARELATITNDGRSPVKSGTTGFPVASRSSPSPTCKT